MRRHLIGVLVGAGALLMPATAAAQPPDFSFQHIDLSHGRDVPGGGLIITAQCNNDGTAQTEVPTSPALTIRLIDGELFRYHAVVRDVPPGDYPVSITCRNSDRTLTTTLRVDARPVPDFSFQNISVNRKQVRPGDTVIVTAVCVNASSGQAEQPSSPALTVLRVEGFFNYVATVRDVAPGSYPVSITCTNSDRTHTTTLSVLGPDAPTPQPAKPQVPVKPKGAAQTGGGGTAG